MSVEYKFDKVEISSIPPPKWGMGFWQRPSTIGFCQQLEELNNGEALRLGLESRHKAQTAHQNLRHRVERAKALGLLKTNYTITGRRSLDGVYYLYIYKERNEPT